MGLDPWPPRPEMEPFYKVGVCPDSAEWKQAREDASRKPRMDASRECRASQGYLLP